MARRNTRIDANSIAVIDRITRDLLAQLELQAQVASVLLEQATNEQRGSFLERLADVRGRLVRLRAQTLGRSTPTLVTVRPASEVPDTPSTTKSPGMEAVDLEIDMSRGKVIDLRHKVIRHDPNRGTFE